MRPVPIAPTLIRLLGAVDPKTEDGTIAGNPAAAADAIMPLPAVAMKCLLVTSFEGCVTYPPAVGLRPAGTRVPASRARGNPGSDLDFSASVPARGTLTQAGGRGMIAVTSATFPEDTRGKIKI
jgi:hypothetical protein